MSSCAEAPEGSVRENGTQLSLRNRNKASTTSGLSTGKDPLWESPGEDHQRRLDRYATARRRTLGMAQWIQQVGPRDESCQRRARALRDCGSYLVFRRLLDSEEQEAAQTHLFAATFCRQHLLCPFCAIRRGAKYCGAYADRALTYSMAHVNHPLLFVTCTIADGPDLVERFGHLHSCLGAMMARRRKARSGSGRHQSSLSVIEGGVGAIEVKRGKNSKQWHPHYHGVWFASSRFDFGAFQREWEQITGDSKFCYVKHLDEWLAFDRGQMMWSEYHDRLPRALVEVFKYPLKFSELAFRDNWTSFLTLFGRRLVNAFGCLRGVEVDESLADVGVDWETATFEEWFYLFSEGGYSRVCERTCRSERDAVRARNPRRESSR